MGGNCEYTSDDIFGTFKTLIHFFWEDISGVKQKNYFWQNYCTYSFKNLYEFVFYLLLTDLMLRIEFVNILNGTSTNFHKYLQGSH